MLDLGTSEKTVQRTFCLAPFYPMKNEFCPRFSGSSCFFFWYRLHFSLVRYCLFVLFHCIFSHQTFTQWTFNLWDVLMILTDLFFIVLIVFLFFLHDVSLCIVSYYQDTHCIATCLFLKTITTSPYFTCGTVIFLSYSTYFMKGLFL